VTSQVNRLLCRNIAAGKFVTFCYAVVDIGEGSVSFANAGHFPPMLVRRTGEVHRLDPTGLVLGITADWAYATGDRALEAGDRMVCFTDGITEATSPDGEEFGEPRLLELVQSNVEASARELTDILAGAVSGWTDGTPQDDATLITVAVA
jgi:sigma-B regulation protein RsbU (phosphoserine phosphatase)